MTETTATPCHDLQHFRASQSVSAATTREFLKHHRTRDVSRSITAWFHRVIGITAAREALRREMRALEAEYDRKIEKLEADRQRTDDLIRHLIEKMDAKKAA